MNIPTDHLQLFNRQHQRDIPVIYDAVTTGVPWNFLKLDWETVYLEHMERAFNLEKNLGDLLVFLPHILEDAEA